MNIYCEDNIFYMKIYLVETGLDKKALLGMDHNLDAILSNYSAGKSDGSILMLLRKLIYKDERRLLPVFDNLVNIAKEMRKYGLDSYDIGNWRNWGVKNGHLAIFDVGYGDKHEHIGDIPMLEEGPPQSAPEIALKLLDKVKGYFNIREYGYLGGNGAAFEIENNNVLKITTDKSEASNALKIRGKNLEYIADIRNVFSKVFEKEQYYIILLEKLMLGTKKYQDAYADIDSYIYLLWKKINNIVW